MHELTQLFDNPPPGSTIIEPGDITVPSGRLSVCDPFQTCASPPFKTTVPKGRFPVQLLLADMKEFGGRVALARMIFSTKPATAWKPAITNWGSNTHMVDSGLSCFMDYETANEFCSVLHAYKFDHPKGNYFGDILDNEIKANKDLWCIHDPLKDGKHNIFIFYGGLGDGMYESWWGTHNNQPVTLTINFGII